VAEFGRLAPDVLWRNRKRHAAASRRAVVDTFGHRPVVPWFGVEDVVHIILCGLPLRSKTFGSSLTAPGQTRADQYEEPPGGPVDQGAYIRVADEEGAQMRGADRQH
jgi:hypothetical protein